jgi:hypothetical protein
LVVDAQEVSPHFPDTVDFTLRAHGFEAYRAELNYRLVGEPVTSGVQAELDAPTANLNLQVSLDLATHYIPPGSEVVYYWALTGDSEETAYTPEKTFTLLDDRHRWQSLTDAQGRVSVHWYEGDDAFGRSLRDTATTALDRLQQDINARLQRPAGIWVYATQDDLLDALPRNIPEWVGGKAFPELALVLAAIPDNSEAEFEIKRVVPHELSHLVLYQATLNPYNTPPAWMEEGVATYYQEAHDPAEEFALRQAAEEGYLSAIKTLSGSFGADDEGALLGYAQSYSVIDFILNDSRYGPQKFARTIAAFREGVTYDEALKAGLGITVDELDSQWRASLPYEVAEPGSAPAPAPGQEPEESSGPAQEQSPTPAWLGNLALLAALGACFGLFLIGAVLTVLALLRRKAARGT